MKAEMKTILFMVAVSVVFTALVSGVHRLTYDQRARNARLGVRRAALHALDPGLVPKGADGATVARLWEARCSSTGIRYGPDGSVSEEGKEILNGLNEEGAPVAYLFPIEGQGLWGDIAGYLAVNRDLTKIVGISFHTQNETPGLGAEITARWFAEAFRGTAIPAEPKGPPGQERYIEFVPRDEDQPGDNKVSAVTGATGTTNGLRKFVNEDLAVFLKVMRGRSETATVSGGEGNE